jgi:glutathione S-transferase
VPARRTSIHLAALFLLPLIVAAFGISVAGAFALVLLMLAWRWAISLSLITAPPGGPELVLESISASHFVEKVRWCLDRLGIEYAERPAGGTLGAFFLGRTVPRLWFRAGVSRSNIGNSSEILRYLWGRYAAERPGEAAFLEATTERLELERRIDRCGADLQVWVYFHLLDHRELTLRAWGANSPAIPAWQRIVLKLLYPLLAFLIRRAFRISPRQHQRAVAHLNDLMSDVEARLADDRDSILGGDAVNYTDLAFAAIMGLWLMPAAYGGGRADPVRIAVDELPEAMRGEIDGWKTRFPRVTRFIEARYAER